MKIETLKKQREIIKLSFPLYQRIKRYIEYQTTDSKFKKSEEFLL